MSAQLPTIPDATDVERMYDLVKSSGLHHRTPPVSQIGKACTGPPSIVFMGIAVHSPDTS
jgi:hypothetical protein